MPFFLFFVVLAVMGTNTELVLFVWVFFLKINFVVVVVYEIQRVV